VAWRRWWMLSLSGSLMFSISSSTSDTRNNIENRFIYFINLQFKDKHIEYSSDRHHHHPHSCSCLILSRETMKWSFYFIFFIIMNSHLRLTYSKVEEILFSCFLFVLEVDARVDVDEMTVKG
jgi:hypothetical protein